jgi:hypothetical protein
MPRMLFGARLYTGDAAMEKTAEAMNQDRKNGLGTREIAIKDIETQSSRFSDNGAVGEPPPRLRRPKRCREKPGVVMLPHPHKG